MILELLKETHLEGENLPVNYYESKKILHDLGLDYKKIDACPLNCILFTKEYADVYDMASLDERILGVILMMVQ